MSETVKFRVLYYIYLNHWLNRGIAAATWLPNMNTEPVSHAELWEPNGDGGLFASGTYIKPANHWTRRFFWGQCWTSTTRGKANGTVVRPASGVLTNPGRWLVTEHSILQYKFEYAKARAQKRVDNNKGYAYSEFVRYAMPFWLFKRTPFYDPTREQCSPHIEQWLFDMGVLDDISLRSPRRLCEDVVRATHVPVRRLIDDVIVRDGDWKKVH